jgi:hypothetical protein
LVGPYLFLKFKRAQFTTNLLKKRRGETKKFRRTVKLCGICNNGSFYELGCYDFEFL